VLGKLFGKIAALKIVGKIFVGENIWKRNLGKNVCNIRCRKYGAIVSCPVHFPRKSLAQCEIPKATERLRIVKPRIQKSINSNLGVELTT